MRDQHWFNLTAAIIAAFVLLWGASMVMFPSPTATPTATTHPATASPTVYRNLSITLNPRTGDFDFSALQLSVPIGVKVVFTITNFDTSTARLTAPENARVTGTIGSTEALSSGGASLAVGSLSATGVSHTFTLSNAYYHLNAPIPPAAASPIQVTFSVVFSVPGTYNWGCVIFCGQAEMMAQGGMFGTLTVA